MQRENTDTQNEIKMQHIQNKKLRKKSFAEQIQIHVITKSINKLTKNKPAI